MKTEFRQQQQKKHKPRFFNAIWQSMAFGTNAQLEQCIENGIHLIVCNNDENKMPIRRLLRWLLFSICKHCVFAIALQWIFCYTLRCKPRKLWATRTPFTISYTPSFCFVVFWFFCWIASSCSTACASLFLFNYCVYIIIYTRFGLFISDDCRTFLCLCNWDCALMSIWTNVCVCNSFV